MHPERFLQPGEHVVKGGGDLGGLVAPGNRYALGELSVADPPGGARQGLQRSQHAAGQGESQQRGHGDGPQLDGGRGASRGIDLAVFELRELTTTNSPSGPAPSSGMAT